MKAFKFIKQHEQKDCGIACTAMVLNHYGSSVPFHRLREKSNTDKQGTTAYGLKKVLEHFKFEVFAIQADEGVWKDAEMVFPAIAHVLLENGFMHYVVVYGIEGDQLLIADPAQGKRKQSITDFNTIWSGVLLIPQPNKDYVIVQERMNGLFYFMPAVFKQKSLLITVIALSFLVTLLSIGSSFYLQILIDTILPQADISRLTLFSLGLIVAYLAHCIIEWERNVLLVSFGQSLSKIVMMDYLKHVVRLPMNFFASRQSGDIISRFLDANKIVDAIGSLSLTLVLDSVMLIVMGVVLAVQHRSLFVTTLSCLPFYVLVIWGFVKKNNHANEEEMSAGSKLNSDIMESINGIETIKANTSETHILQRIDKHLDDYITKMRTLAKLEISQQSLKQLIRFLTTAITLWFGASLVMSGQLTLGQLMSYNALVIYFTEPLQSIINLQVKFQTAMVANTRLQEVLSLETERSMEEDNNVDFRGTVSLNQVNYRYDDYAEILRDINLKIPYGQKVALIGQSGSGKSTLAKLMVNFFHATEGEIHFKDQEIHDIPTTQLRQAITYVPQEAFLVSGTLYDNLVLGLDREVNEAQMQSVLDFVELRSLVDKHPLGLYMAIEEKGTNLSGGQKQRLALARALLRDSAIYILDEATSAMDMLLERCVIERLMALDKTVIFIAHQLTAIHQCDQIIVLQDGKVVGTGTHSDLVKESKHYQALYLQVS